MTEIVEVYRNLHKDCWSVRDSKTRLVISHVDYIHLQNATLVVRPAGREKVLREKRKNVHAFIKGTVAACPKNSGQMNCRYIESFEREPWPIESRAASPILSVSCPNTDAKQITYNPYRNESFVLQATGKPITHADNVYLNNQGKAFI
jgi:hypothetical protein